MDSRIRIRTKMSWIRNTAKERCDLFVSLAQTYNYVMVGPAGGGLPAGARAPLCGDREGGGAAGLHLPLQVVSQTVIRIRITVMRIRILSSVLIS
jgi:hypothetical protein